MNYPFRFLSLARFIISNVILTFIFKISRLVIVTIHFMKISCLVTIRQLSIHGNARVSCWRPDALPDVNQLGSGKRHWNLTTSSAEMEFCLCIIITIYFENVDVLPCC